MRKEGASSREGLPENKGGALKLNFFHFGWSPRGRIWRRETPFPV